MNVLNQIKSNPKSSNQVLVAIPRINNKQTPIKKDSLTSLQSKDLNKQ